MSGPLRTLRSAYLEYNSGAFVSDGEACLVDPGILPGEIAALARLVDGLEISTIVLTHADWDHVLGPEHLPKATVVAQERFEGDLDPTGIRVMLAKLEETAGVTREPMFEPPHPDLAFAEELVLPVGSLELRLMHAPGHAASMLTVYEPASETLWAADILSDTEIPSVIHDLTAYERTLERAGQLAIRTLVPGHGTQTHDRDQIGRRLREDRDYLAMLRTNVESAVERGLPLGETVSACMPSPLLRGADDETTHRLNVEKVYVDLGGDAEPTKVGFARAWLAATGR